MWEELCAASYGAHRRGGASPSSHLSCVLLPRVWKWCDVILDRINDEGIHWDTDPWCWGPFNSPRLSISTLLTQEGNTMSTLFKGASLVAQLVKNLPAMEETWVQFLGWEDPLEKEMATHSSILAWRIPEEPGRLQFMGWQELDTT